MAEIINNTLRPITLHNKELGEYKIYPQDSKVIDDKAWNYFKKNGAVNRLIVNKDLVALDESPSLLKKIKNFFY